MNESSKLVDNEKLNIEQLLAGPFHRMSHVYRYSSLPVIRRENVAEHSWYVAFYAYILACDLIQRGYSVDIGVLLTRALVHDIDESMTGDFLRYVKYGHPDLKRILDEVSESMISKMSEGLCRPYCIKDPWASAKASDIEGDIIQVVDLARVVSYVLEELKTGNNNLFSILPEVKKYLRQFVDARKQSPVSLYALQICDWLGSRYGT